MIHLESVTVTFGGRRVLDGLSLAVEPGEIFGLIGPNGAGKTTAVSVICGALEPDAGTVRVAGRPPAGDGLRALGVAGQEAALYADLTCRENLELFAGLYGLSRREAAARAAEVIGLLGLDPQAGRRVRELSGGWRRRCHVAVALVHRPAAVVLDEPEAGLDAAGRTGLRAVLRRLAREGTAILVTTHHLESAQAVCTRVGILHGGTLAAEGPVGDLLRAYPAALVAEVETAAPERLAARLAELRWGSRDRGGRRLILLPERLPFGEVAAALAPVPLVSLALREVSLEDVFWEITGEDGAGAARPAA